MFSKKAESTEPIEAEDAPAPDAPAADLEAPSAPIDPPSDRFEEYDAVKPDGGVVHIRRNIETGATEIVNK